MPRNTTAIALAIITFCGLIVVSVVVLIALDKNVQSVLQLALFFLPALVGQVYLGYRVDHVTGTANAINAKTNMIEEHVSEIRENGNGKDKGNDDLPTSSS